MEGANLYVNGNDASTLENEKVTSDENFTIKTIKCENVDDVDYVSSIEINDKLSMEASNNYIEDQEIDTEAPPLPKRSPNIEQKMFFENLFNWDMIEQRFQEPNSSLEDLRANKSTQNHVDVLEKSSSVISGSSDSKDKNVTGPTLTSEKGPVKYRDKQTTGPRSEAERKRRSKDLLQNRRSTGFLSFEEVERAIKEIEEIGSEIQQTLEISNTSEATTNIAEPLTEPSEEIIKDDNDEANYGPVILRDKKSSPYNSASARKRRSRNLLLNRRSTGHVSAEDVEKAKSMDNEED